MRCNVIGLSGLLSAVLVSVNAEMGTTSLGGNSALGSGVIGSPDGIIQGGIPTGLAQGIGGRRLGGFSSGMGIGNAGNFGRRLDSPMYTNQALGRGFGSAALLGASNFLDRGGQIDFSGARGNLGLLSGSRKRR